MKEERITDRQILKHLNSKRNSLLSELSKIDLAIQALGGKIFGNATDEKQTLNRSVKSQGKLVPPEKYSKGDTIDNKIAFALSQLKEADKSTIITEILRQEPSQDTKKLEGNIAVRLSYLLKKEMIKGKKTGRIYLYSLISGEC
ncbi:hypothetical protein KZP23_17060 [Echinicola marina]|uniref:hypothetical protein n=1 Tax=Echinicola marina TaxID=2859768 RepID=UPI001CF690AE|nr:hypothetical protein [Echinicola marina]UCS92395.1 hypothetical protein KZP23_17060 [Echinicola marina]